MAHVLKDRTWALNFQSCPTSWGIPTGCLNFTVITSNSVFNSTPNLRGTLLLRCIKFILINSRYFNSTPPEYGDFDDINNTGAIPVTNFQFHLHRCGIST